MKQFTTIEKLDTGILYALELASSVSVLLLAFGLIASMANVLTKGSVLSNSAIMRQIWAWTQCIAIDASVAGTIIRTFHYHQEGERVKTWLYGLLSILLLFTAAIVSNIEAVQQTLNITLDKAYTHVFVSIEALTWVRSISVVLIIVAHSLRHVRVAKKTHDEPVSTTQETQPPQLVITPDLLETLRGLLAQSQTTISEGKAEAPLFLTQGQAHSCKGGQAWIASLHQKIVPCLAFNSRTYHSRPREIPPPRTPILRAYLFRRNRAEYHVIHARSAS